MYNPHRPQVRMGPALTPLTRNALIVLVSIYVAQLILQNWVGLPVLETLGWWGPQDGRFRLWQPVTAFMLNGPAPLSAAIDWLILYFFLPPAEESLHRRLLFRFLGISWLVAVCASLGLQFLGVLEAGRPYVGLGAVLIALLVLFGLSRPTARILLFFIIPIRAGWVAWASGLLSFLYFLSTRELTSSVIFFGWVGAVAWMYSGGSMAGLASTLGRLTGAGKRKRKKGFDVIDGGGPKDEGPTWH